MKNAVQVILQHIIVFLPSGPRLRRAQKQISGRGGGVACTSLGVWRRINVKLRHDGGTQKFSNHPDEYLSPKCNPRRTFPFNFWSNMENNMENLAAVTAGVKLDYSIHFYQLIISIPSILISFRQFSSIFSVSSRSIRWVTGSSLCLLTTWHILGVFSVTWGSPWVQLHINIYVQERVKTNFLNYKNSLINNFHYFFFLPRND